VFSKSLFFASNFDILHLEKFHSAAKNFEISLPAGGFAARRQNQKFVSK